MAGRILVGDCGERWWSDEPELSGELHARLRRLWAQLEQETGPTTLVTHSNVIQELCNSQFI